MFRLCLSELSSGRHGSGDKLTCDVTLWAMTASCSIHLFIRITDRCSSVDRATCCGTEGRGIESEWVAKFSVPVQTDRGVHPASYTKGTGTFRGCGLEHLQPSSSEAKENVELHLYSPSGSSWPVLGRILPLPIYIYIYI